MTTFGLPYACILAEKRKKKLPILLDEIRPHWRRLCVIGEEVDANFSIMEEWNAIQECVKRAPYKMKLFIKYKLRELGFQEETMLKPPSMSLCLRSRCHQRNQQMSTILLLVTLQLRKNQSKISKSWMKTKIMHYH